MASAPDSTANPAATTHFQLPTFSAVNPSVWFRRAEIQFRLKRISNTRTQADHVLASLSDSLFPQISEWLDSKGEDAVEYADLKTFLLQKFHLSPEKRVNEILNLSKQVLGDQRPSEALTEMRTLARRPTDTGGTKTIDLLVALWLQRLPTPVRAAITDFADKDDKIIAAQADSILAAHTAAGCSPIQVAAAPESPDDDHSDDAIAVASSSFRPTVQYRPPLRSRTPPPKSHPPKEARSTSRRHDFASKLCYYHARFGPAAKKCEKFCSWSKNAQ